MSNTWIARYCEGWNGPQAEVVGPIDPAEARRRDTMGLPYSVVVSEGTIPRYVLDIAWGQDYLARWNLDDRKRRVSRAVHRRMPDGRLFERKLTQWQYEDTDVDGDPVLARETFDRGLNGVTDVYDRDRSGSSHTRTRETPSEFMRAPVTFGSWTSVLGIDQDLHEAPGPARSSESSLPRPWLPPMPYQAPYLGNLLNEGATVIFEDSSTPVEVQHEYLGLLGLPTGRVVACDPTWGTKVEPFTVAVAPGDYPVVEIQIHQASGGSWAAAGFLLRISYEATATWELALRPGQDVKCLDDGHFYGFGVDAGLGSLMDASTHEALLAYIDGDHYQFHDEVVLRQEFTIPETDLNLFAYGCYLGDGSYPTWIGRDEAGAVTCFLSDMLIVDNGQPNDDDETFEQDW
ncbi:DUF4241 domain-containing protein [Glycomyces niveus]|uniref:DUF4241 domain-containing protein n=1 Tax=Glycomyces niveus TaxID=2820287 RepID=A0ABS3UDC7_9ACTN|nr:DUF4241 domain-containing protein [Glycomyces sp. NEAU-S30]MBO3735707.1 DUF4241 domain-containing protein [Glycomyces sp. NEAU-S30]